VAARQRVATIGAALVALLVPCSARAQTDLQLWGNFYFDWIKDHRITMGVDAEPKVLVSKPSGDPEWATLDITPSFEYSRGEWFDMIGELLVAYTKQNDDLTTTEVTPRVGFRFHILSNLRDDLEKEHRPKRRLVLRDLVRLEWRNLYYSTDKPDSSTLRFRNRFETQWPLNRQKVTDNGATYLTADWEWFIPADDPAERFANSQRIRSGIGYRHSFAWRFEAMYVWNRTRNTIDEPFTTSYHAIDLTMKRVW
jgi:Protein of unknown function (DUF2490)